jgi:hypothetical protein
LSHIKEPFKRAPVSTKRRHAFVLTPLDKNRRISNPVQATLANTSTSWQRIQEETPTLRRLYEYLNGARAESAAEVETPEAEYIPAPALQGC